MTLTVPTANHSVKFAFYKQKINKVKQNNIITNGGY